MPQTKTATSVLCEPAQSKSTYARIYRKKAGTQSEHPDQSLALTCLNSYRTNPSVWTHCLGNKKRWVQGTEVGDLLNKSLLTGTVFQATSMAETTSFRSQIYNCLLQTVSGNYLLSGQTSQGGQCHNNPTKTELNQPKMETCCAAPSPSSVLPESNVYRLQKLKLVAPQVSGGPSC